MSDIFRLPSGTIHTGDTTPIGDRQSAPSENVKKVFVFTEPDVAVHLDFAKTLEHTCESGNLSFGHARVRGGDLQAKIRELRADGTIGDETQIIVDMHGSLKSEHLSDNASTYDFIGALREPLEKGGKTCSATVFITGCQSGDDVLRSRLQALHNEYGSGVCILLSSHKDVRFKSYQQPLMEMCATLSRAASSTPHKLFAEMASHRIDCLTMIEANRAHPVIIHAPKTTSDYGRANLKKTIEEEALVIVPDKGTVGDVTCGGLKGARSAERERWDRPLQGAKARAVGDIYSLEKLLEFLEEPEPDYAKPFGALQGGLVQERSAARSDGEGLKKLLESDEGFVSAYCENKWNDAHTTILKLMAVAAEDGNEKNRADRLAYLFELLEKKKDVFHGLDEDQRRTVARAVMEPSDALDLLISKGFFVAPENQGTWEDKIEIICETAACYGTPVEVKQLIDHLKFSTEISKSSWTDSHVVLANMFCAALDDENTQRRKEKCEQISTLLSPQFKKWVAGAAAVELEPILTSRPGWKDDFDRAPWSTNSGKLVIYTLESALHDDNEARRDQKCAWLYSLLSRKKRSFDWCADRHELIAEIQKTRPNAYKFLAQRGYFKRT